MDRVSFAVDQSKRITTCAKHGDFESKLILRNIWTPCPACIKESDERKAAEYEEARQQHIRDCKRREWEKMLGDSGIPERFLDRTLDSYVASNATQSSNLAYCQDYANRFAALGKRGASILMTGKPGTGKTHLSCGIALQIMRQNNASVLFTTVMRAVRRVKDTWSKASEESETNAIKALAMPDLLILDEVGVQFGSETEKNILFDVINERYEKRRPSIFISNLGREEVIGYLGARIYDRLKEDGGKLLIFDWESHRGKK